MQSLASPSEFITAQDIADATGLKVAKVNYRLLVAGVKPLKIAGMTRLFPVSALEAVRNVQVIERKTVAK